MHDRAMLTVGAFDMYSGTKVGNRASPYCFRQNSSYSSPYSELKTVSTLKSHACYITVCDLFTLYFSENILKTMQSNCGKYSFVPYILRESKYLMFFMLYCVAYSKSIKTVNELCTTVTEYKYDLNIPMTTKEIIDIMQEQLKKKGLELEEYVREIDEMKKIEDETLNDNININEPLQKQRPHITELMEHSKEADSQ